MTSHSVAVVTGGTSGIGQAIACALATRGDDVIIVGRNPVRLDATLGLLQQVNPKGRHRAAPLDVGSPEDMAALADICREEYGRVDVLVASAGVGQSDGSRRLPPPSRDLPLEEWQAVLQVNLHGVFLSNTALLPLMQAQGTGTIINIGSSTTPNGLRGKPLAPAYCASKFAMAALTRSLAEEAAAEDSGVQISVVYPGSVATPLISDTLLDGPFGGSISAAHFATAVVQLIELGGEVSLPDPHLLPMPTRPPQRTT